MKRYTVGFIFTPDYSQVLLVRKNRPQWQAGKLNGIGGKIEEGESSLECVVREIEEETALKIPSKDWVFVGVIGTGEYSIDFYTTVYNGALIDAQTTTDEEVAWHKVNALAEEDEIINNVPWLIQIALDKHKNNEFQSFTVINKS